MPNGFHGPIKEWQRLEAPYLVIDATLEDFAKSQNLELWKNYRDADRSLHWNDGTDKAIWIASMDKYGDSGTYQVSVVAHQDRGTERYVKHGIVGNDIAIGDLAQMIKKAHLILSAWSEDDLHLAVRGGEKSEML